MPEPQSPGSGVRTGWAWKTLRLRSELARTSSAMAKWMGRRRCMRPGRRWGGTRWGAFQAYHRWTLSSKWKWQLEKSLMTGLVHASRSLLYYSNQNIRDSSEAEAREPDRRIRLLLLLFVVWMCRKHWYTWCLFWPVSRKTFYHRPQYRHRKKMTCLFHLFFHLADFYHRVANWEKRNSQSFGSNVLVPCY